MYSSSGYVTTAQIVRVYIHNESKDKVSLGEATLKVYGEGSGFEITDPASDVKQSRFEKFGTSITAHLPAVELKPDQWLEVFRFTLVPKDRGRVRIVVEPVDNNSWPSTYREFTLAGARVFNEKITFTEEQSPTPSPVSHTPTVAGQAPAATSRGFPLWLGFIDVVGVFVIIVLIKNILNLLARKKHGKKDQS